MVPIIIRELEGVDDFSKRRVADLLSSTFPPDAESRRPEPLFLCRTRQGKHGAFWLPLPWHPIFKHANFRWIFRELGTCPHWRALILMADGRVRDDAAAIDVRIAWQLRSQSFMSSTRRINIELNGTGQVFTSTQDADNDLASGR